MMNGIVIGFVWVGMWIGVGYYWNSRLKAKYEVHLVTAAGEARAIERNVSARNLAIKRLCVQDFFAKISPSHATSPPTIDVRHGVGILSAMKALMLVLVGGCGVQGRRESFILSRICPSA